MGRKTYGMAVSSHSEYGYAEYMINIERLKNSLEPGRTYDLYEKQSYGKVYMHIRRILVEKRHTYAVKVNTLEKILEEITRIENECHNYGHNHIFCMGAIGMAGHVKGIIRKYMNYHSGDTTEMVSWIPVEEDGRRPEDESYVLVSFENSTILDIARYEEDEEGGRYYPGDDEEQYSKYGLFVNAWMPLPKPHKGE